MQKNTILLCCLLSLIGCTTTEKQNNPDYESQANRGKNKITASESRLMAFIDEKCGIDEQAIANNVSDKVQEGLADDFSTLTQNVNRNSPNAMKIDKCEPQSNVSDKDLGIGDKFLMGEVEKVFLTKEELSFDARIDSGAVTSSLGVFNLTKFQRDGKNWIKFSLSKETDSPVFEYPILSTIKIVQQRSVVAEPRPVINLQFTLGTELYTSKFNLADRSHLEYQVLIGREFLRDRAVVDVSTKYLLGGK